MPSTIPAKESEYVAYLANFVLVATDNQTELGLTMTDINILNATIDSVNTQISNVMSAQSALKAAHVYKTAELKSSETLLKTYAKKIQVNPQIPNALKKSLGINVRAANTHTPPTIPTMLVVSGNSLGVNALVWKSNGNLPGTVYFVERMCADIPTWTLIDATTRTKYAATGCKPGEQAAYRVYAKRNGQESEYSNTAIIYGP